MNVQNNTDPVFMISVWFRDKISLTLNAEIRDVNMKLIFDEFSRFLEENFFAFDLSLVTFTKKCSQITIRQCAAVLSACRVKSFSFSSSVEKTDLCALLRPAVHGVGLNCKNPPKIRLKKSVKRRIIIGPAMI